jgi:DNA-binding LacI/PurR family transcriptional regulator
VDAGFDDISIAVHNNPTLTNVRQPLEIGEAAARYLLERIGEPQPWMPKIVIEPELMVRDSTGPALTEHMCGA